MRNLQRRFLFLSFCRMPPPITRVTKGHAIPIEFVDTTLSVKTRVRNFHFLWRAHSRLAQSQKKGCGVGSLVILVNSRSFDDVATQQLLISLRKVQFKILVVSQGKTAGIARRDRGVFELKVTHNSIDFTALIAVAENQAVLKEVGLLAQYWFYTHATTDAGPSFGDRLEHVCHETMLSRRLIPDSNHNIGLYKNTDIIKTRAWLLKHKSSQFPSEKEVRRLKSASVIYEDGLFPFLDMDPPIQHQCRFKTDGDDQFFSCDELHKLQIGQAQSPAERKDQRKKIRTFDVYGTGTYRLPVYFDALDFVKFKANFVNKSDEEWILTS